MILPRDIFLTGKLLHFLLFFFSRITKYSDIRICHAFLPVSKAPTYRFYIFQPCTCTYILMIVHLFKQGERRGSGIVVIGLTTTYSICAYHH